MDEADCPFCRIVQGKAKHHLLAGNRHALAILDIMPLSRGHALIISRRHAPYWHELSDDELAGLLSLAREVAGKLKRAFEPDFVALFARGRRVPHTHVFLVPSFRNDPLDRFYDLLEAFQEGPAGLVGLRTPEALEGTARMLKDA